MNGEKSHGAGLTLRQVGIFRRMITVWHKENRRSLPWRETRDPYAILVSEIMLQQTRVDRVQTKYASFLSLFPDVATLARAPLESVLAAWQGLGYNRRAVALWRCGQAVMERYDGSVPPSVEELESLSGIGPYTARAIATFAFGQPQPFIETNIRSVFIHHFFADRDGVRDRDILPLVAQTLDRSDPREWFYALMDYGATLKRNHANPSRRSAHHSSQTPFKGSNRELRSRILRAILAGSGITLPELLTTSGADPGRVTANLLRLGQEGFIVEKEGRWSIR